METDDETIDQNAALPLAVAARLAFPKGGMTGRGLKREADKGKLIVEKIGNRIFTSLTAIEQMRKLCRLENNPLASGLDRQAQTEPQSGSSSTQDGKSALAAARLTLATLKIPSKPIWQPSA